MGASSVYTLSKKLASASPLGLEEESFYLALIVLLPLIGALVSFLPRFFSRSIVEDDPTHSRGSGTTGRAPSALSGWLASSFSFASFLMVCSLFFSRAFQEGQSVFSYLFWTWIKVGEFEVPLALRFDHLAGVMSLVVTGVGTLIHVYAIGYMKEDKDQPRFFAYLNLFLFAMLFLVLGDSLLTMFIGWEGVGVCSYLLIGFWFKDMVNAKAGQKAFVVNRIGDAGFIMGIFLLFSHAHTLQFVELPQAISTMPLWLLELSALCLFVGAIGKSAQIPLYVWLPDAMAGPTPVSALIHAATMVTAGVYMVSRMSTLFLFAPIVMTLISIVGVTTAFLAATIALVQVDIKKVLAYSTVSQLGFMFMALGAGAFSHGIFHVVTHAFFKACLFMSAGSVIMGCHHEQDMRKFGGLGKLMPVTAFCYLAASLAIAGFPFTSGFYSKDALLWTVFSNPILNETSVNGLSLAHAIWFIGAVTAFLTAFYMTRSFVMTFLGSYRGHHHPNESPLVVTVPIFILAILSLFFGLFSGEKLVHFLSDWTRSDMLISHVVLKENAQYHLLEIISILISLFGICAAFLLYTKGEALLSFARIRGEAGHRFLFNKWWVDELYDFLICRPLALGAKMCAFIVDPFLIDGMSKGLASFISASSDAVSQLQTGRLGVYCLFMVIATCALMGVIF